MARGSPREFSISCPQCGDAGKAGGVNHQKNESDLLVVNVTIFLIIVKISGQSEKVVSQSQLLLRIFTKKFKFFFVGILRN